VQEHLGRHGGQREGLLAAPIVDLFATPIGIFFLINLWREVNDFASYVADVFPFRFVLMMLNSFGTFTERIVIIIGAVSVIARGKKRYRMLGTEKFNVIVVKHMSQQNQTEVLNCFSDNTDICRINMEMSQSNALRNSETVSTHEPVE